MSNLSILGKIITLTHARGYLENELNSFNARGLLRAGHLWAAKLFVNERLIEEQRRRLLAKNDPVAKALVA